MITTATIEAFSVAEAIAKADEIYKAFGNKVDIDLSILAGDNNAERAARLGYAFPWLKTALNTQTAPNKTGAIEFDHFAGIGNKPQKIASAASAIESAGLMGASFKPILFVGTQVVKGINYWFIAEQTIITNPPQKKIVTIAVNEFDGEFEIVKGSIHEIRFEISE